MVKRIRANAIGKLYHINGMALSELKEFIDKFPGNELLQECEEALKRCSDRLTKYIFISGDIPQSSGEIPNIVKTSSSLNLKDLDKLFDAMIKIYQEVSKTGAFISEMESIIEENRKDLLNISKKIKSRIVRGRSI